MHNLPYFCFALLHCWMTCPISATILLLNEKYKTCRIFLSNEEYKMNRMTDFSKSFLQDLNHLNSRFSVKLTLIDITTVIRYEQEVVKVQSHIYNFSCQFYKTQSSQFFFYPNLIFSSFFFKDTCWYNYINWIPTTLWF